VCLLSILVSSSLSYEDRPNSYQRPRNRFGNDPLNYRITTQVATTTRRSDPDSYFFGFFPLWSVFLVGLTSICLCVALFGIFCWLVGMINPIQQARLARQNEKRIYMQRQEALDEFNVESKLNPSGNHQSEEVYDDISMRMFDNTACSGPTSNQLDTNVTSRLFNDSKLTVNTAGLYEQNTGSEVDHSLLKNSKLKKKMFRRECL